MGEGWDEGEIEATPFTLILSLKGEEIFIANYATKY